MKIEQLEYVIEVDRTKSITQAARNLFMMQPNLSKAIQDLENSVGIKIFHRTRNGTYTTEEGEVFIRYAKEILAQINALESRYQKGEKDTLGYKIAVPRATYIAYAFSQFVKNTDLERQFNIHFHETSTLEAIVDVVQNNYDVGVIRYSAKQEDYFLSLLASKGLQYQIMWEFEYVIIMGDSHALRDQQEISYADLNPYTEIKLGDIEPAKFSVSQISHVIPTDLKRHQITIYERGSQFDLLTNVPNAYVMGSPLPKEYIEHHHLVQRRCHETDLTHKDVLIFKDKALLDHPLVRDCIEKLEETRDEILAMNI